MHTIYYPDDDILEINFSDRPIMSEVSQDTMPKGRLSKWSFLRQRPQGLGLSKSNSGRRKISFL